MDGVNEYRCECVQGFEGSNCYYPTNECEGVQCQNGGKCFDGHNEYFCQCKYGFTGIQASIKIVSNFFFLLTSTSSLMFY